MQGALHPGAQVEMLVTLGCSLSPGPAALWRRILPPRSRPSPPKGLLFLLSSDNVRGEGLSHRERSALLLMRQDICGPFPCTWVGSVSLRNPTQDPPCLFPRLPSHGCMAQFFFWLPVPMREGHLAGLRNWGRAQEQPGAPGSLFPSGTPFSTGAVGLACGCPRCWQGS